LLLIAVLQLPLNLNKTINIDIKMRKLTLFLLLAVLVGLQAVAIPAHRGSVLMPQPDGTLVTVCLEGDEFYHFNTTADGYTIMLNEAGAYVYAQADGMTLVPTLRKSQNKKKQIIKTN